MKQGFRCQVVPGQLDTGALMRTDKPATFSPVVERNFRSCDSIFPPSRAYFPGSTNSDRFRQFG